MLELFEIKQYFDSPSLSLTSLKTKIEKEMDKLLSCTPLPANASVAITAGSRGISNMAFILKVIVEVLKDRSLSPFLVPAMGSHGGATAEGQIEVLEHLGITEQTVGAPIRSSMNVDYIGETNSGTPVYMDQHSLSADGIIVVNRIKAHTAFRGKVESGLSKMIAIGLGKIKGATFIHQGGALKMAETIESASKMALKHSPILFGLGIIENGYDETADLVGVTKEEWHQKETELLAWSKRMMPSLPVDDIDLLIVEEMGKCFSGTGMDPNIIGRWRIQGVQEPERPTVKRIAVLDLAEQSFGNAQGVGLADFMTDALFKKIDRKSTYTNALTSTYLQRAMLPFIYATEEEAIRTAVQSLGPQLDNHKLRIVQIPNTLHLGRVIVSKSIIEELKQTNKSFDIIRQFRMEFNEAGQLQVKITRHKVKEVL
ncbi:lactate racemase domain-containing protein [Fictibacillus enclensis]|uniref:lactate racemase domain-containing protein n=1 Tax=Fictibacillus enclensis TaxID=1017270 RepID=UPI0025A27899|nr:lactate racemase domain-containing protein [Fictibacillus enclensis]MDM5340448.1 lactate racemase domain-containing protein [Fictibacillus enclensis]